MYDGAGGSGGSSKQREKTGMTRRCCQGGSEGCWSFCDAAASDILFHSDSVVANSKVLVNTHPYM